MSVDVTKMPKLGFGMMRLPEKDGELDLEQICKMVDAYLASGMNYFDTAYMYCGGKSESIVKKALVERHPRESFTLTTKLPQWMMDEGIEGRDRIFNDQLARTGAGYFDYYLLHSVEDGANYDGYVKYDCFNWAKKKKEEGLIKHFGFSFHGTPELLDKILSEHPEVEIVQIQMNYIDMESTAVDARRVYETCLRFHKPVIVMEPVKGGSLVKLPPKAQHLFDTLQQGAYPKASNASYAIRFVAGHEGIFMVLSGMSTLSQVADNTSFMKDFKPLTDKEKRTLDGVVEVFSQLDAVPCTACRYCIEENHCPKKIPIPDIFSLLNSMRVFNNHNANFYYENVVTANAGKASDCILCGACEHVCPQHLTIRKFLKEVGSDV